MCHSSLAFAHFKRIRWNWSPCRLHYTVCWCILGLTENHAVTSVDWIEMGLTLWPLGNFNEILGTYFPDDFSYWWLRYVSLVNLPFRWMSLDLTDDKSTLVQVMAWCHQATSHYLSQCWPRSLSSYGITRPQWVNAGMVLPVLFWFQSDIISVG